MQHYSPVYTVQLAQWEAAIAAAIAVAAAAATAAVQVIGDWPCTFRCMYIHFTTLTGSVRGTYCPRTDANTDNETSRPEWNYTANLLYSVCHQLQYYIYISLAFNPYQRPS